LGFGIAAAVRAVATRLQAKVAARTIAVGVQSRDFVLQCRQKLVNTTRVSFTSSLALCKMKMLRGRSLKHMNLPTDL
jgi:hypothetical protein